MPNKLATINEYLARLPKDQQAALQKLRAAIKKIVPEAEECISYQLPAFRLDGKVLVGYGARANHCAFYPMSGTTVAKFQKELGAYETSKGTIRFPTDRPLPAALLRKLVKTRAKEIRSPAQE